MCFLQEKTAGTFCVHTGVCCVFPHGTGCCPTRAGGAVLLRVCGSHADPWRAPHGDPASAGGCQKRSQRAPPRCSVLTGAASSHPCSPASDSSPDAAAPPACDLKSHYAHPLVSGVSPSQCTLPAKPLKTTPLPSACLKCPRPAGSAQTQGSAWRARSGRGWDPCLLPPRHLQETEALAVFCFASVSPTCIFEIPRQTEALAA